MICEACESVLNPSLSVCPVCGHAVGTDPSAGESTPPSVPSRVAAVAPFVGDGAVTIGVEEPGVAAPPLDDPVERLSALRYRSSVGRARLVRIYLVAWAALMGISAAHDFGALRMVGRLAVDPLTVVGADVLAVVDRARLIALVQAVAELGFVVVMAMWLYRVYRNLPALGARTRHRPAWAIWGWIVPIANFFRPKQMVNDCWRTSDPAAPAEQGAVAWLTNPVPLSVHLWWVMQIIIWVASLAMFDAGRATRVGDAQRVFSVLVFTDVVRAVFGVFTFWVATRITSRQERRAAAVLRRPEAWEPEWATRMIERRPGARPRVSLVVGAPALVLLAGVVAWFAFEGSLEGPYESLSGRASIAPLDLAVGDCFDLPPDLQLIVAVPVAPCDGEHDLEVFHIVHHPGSSSAPYPGWDSLFQAGVAECGGDAFEQFVGLPYGESALDVLVISPPAMAWDAGARFSVCSVFRFDRLPLVGPAEGQRW